MATKIYFFSFALVLIVQTVFSFDCSTLDENQDVCNELQDSGLPDDEMDALISNLNYEGKFMPDHEHVYDRNVNLDIANAPVDTDKVSKTYIKDAWVSLFAAMPSVLYGNSLFVPDNVMVLTGFNHRIVVPSNYNNNGYPSESQRDCKRTYSLTASSADNRVYVNGNLVGSGRLVDASISSDSEIKAVYDVSASVRIKHYRWNEYCCGWNKHGCIEYCHDCDYSYTETRTDNVHLEDSINVKHYENELDAHAEIVNSYAGTSKVRFSFTDTAKLSFKDSYYDFNRFTYDIEYSKEPYYVYTIRATDYNQESFENLYKDSQDIVVNNIEDCSISASDFFDTIKKDCGLSFEAVNLTIKTDKLKYKPDEDIHVTIEPSNIPVRLSYNNEIRQVTGSAVLSAKPLKNRITAVYNDIESDRVIYVADKDRFAIIYNLTVFGFINYLLYALAKKYWGGFI